MTIFSRKPECGQDAIGPVLAGSKPHPCQTMHGVVSFAHAGTAISGTFWGLCLDPAGLGAGLSWDAWELSTERSANDVTGAFPGASRHHRQRQRQRLDEGGSLETGLSPSTKPIFYCPLIAFSCYATSVVFPPLGYPSPLAGLLGACCLSLTSMSKQRSPGACSRREIRGRMWSSGVWVDFGSLLF
jgi:hypothetical protein